MSPPASLIEPLIALSILFVTIETIIVEHLSPCRIVVVFGFRMLHNLGFAGALTRLGLLPKMFVESLVVFNIGMESGRISVILLAWVLIGRWAADRL